LKYDEDKNFVSANLRAAFNQVRVLDENGYGLRGEFVEALEAYIVGHLLGR